MTRHCTVKKEVMKNVVEEYFKEPEKKVSGKYGNEEFQVSTTLSAAFIIFFLLYFTLLFLHQRVVNEFVVICICSITFVASYSLFLRRASYISLLVSSGDDSRARSCGKIPIATNDFIDNGVVMPY